ncbi:hypothetical protein HII31_02899 [Pseudocercospora fuligena]|uniref:Uncharacterized protein n=1 Tax=Pseudocercospora fuligena TaxID=685502 RepID=A0A8H6VPI1_9PEZI|nr:hypothetical protein HII31_02899 [Pseudocercospora fuligena]
MWNTEPYLTQHCGCINTEADGNAAADAEFSSFGTERDFAGNPELQEAQRENANFASGVDVATCLTRHQHTDHITVLQCCSVGRLTGFSRHSDRDSFLKW